MRSKNSILSYIDILQTKYQAISELGALAHCLQRCTNCRTAEVCIFFQMTQNGVCIRSVFEQKIGPYKVCILVNMGPLERLAALSFLPQVLGKAGA